MDFPVLLTCCFLLYSGTFKSCTDAFLFVKNTKIQSFSKPSLFRYIKFIFYTIQSPIKSFQKLKCTKISLKNHSLSSFYFLLTDENQSIYTSKAVNKDEQIFGCEILGDFILDCFQSENRKINRIFSFTYNTLLIKKELSIKKDHLDHLDINIQNNFEMILSFEETWKTSQIYENELNRYLSGSPKYNLKMSFKSKLEHVNSSHRANMGLVSKELDVFKKDILIPVPKKRKDPPKKETPKKIQKKFDSPLKEQLKLAEKIKELTLDDPPQIPKVEIPKLKEFPKLNPLNIELLYSREGNIFEMNEKSSPQKIELPKLDLSNIPKPPELTIPKAPRGNHQTLLSPRRGLKKVHWKPLNERTIEKQSIWSSIKIDDSSLTIDHGKLEDLFSIDNNKQPKEIKENKNMNVIHLIGLSRSRNIEIILKKMKNFSEKQIIEMIDKIDINNLDLESIKCIQSMIPTKEEEESLKKFKGNLNEISNIDQFLLNMIKIERLREKVKSLEYAVLTYESSNNDLFKTMNQRIELFNQIRTSQKFQKLLEVVLVVGNFLNEQKSKGFKLDVLLQLNTIKSRDGKTNLMEFITMTSIKEKLDDFYLDFEIEDKLSISDFEEEIKRYKIIQEHFDKELKFCKEENEITEKIFKFYSQSKENFEMLKSKFEELKQTIEVTLKHFGEDKKDTEFLELLRQFIKEFQKSKETVKRKKMFQ